MKLIEMIQSLARYQVTRGESRTTTTSKMERFAIKFNGFQPLTIITKRFILDVAVGLEPPLVTVQTSKMYTIKRSK